MSDELLAAAGSGSLALRMVLVVLRSRDGSSSWPVANGMGQLRRRGLSTFGAALILGLEQWCT